MTQAITPPGSFDADKAVALARQTCDIEAAAIQALGERLGSSLRAPFARATRM